MFARITLREASNALAAVGRARAAAKCTVVVVNPLSKPTAPSKSLARGLSRSFSSGPPPQPPLDSSFEHEIKRKPRSVPGQPQPDERNHADSLASFEAKWKFREVDLEKKHQSALIALRSSYQPEFDTLRLNEHSRHSVDKELFAALGDAKATEFWQQKRDLLIDQQRAMRSKLVEEKRALRIAQAKETVANFYQKSPITRAADFKELTIDGHTMRVAEHIPDSDIEGPMYIPTEAFDLIQRFVECPISNNPLVLVGPPKCGKSAVLNHVIPSMVAQYSTDLEPIFVRFQFNLTEPPEKAIESLMAALFDVGDIFKLDLAEVTTSFRENPYHYCFISDVVYWMALKFEETHHKRVWLLLDECQAPILNSDTSKDAVHFAAILKYVIGKLGKRARFVMTGSSMVSFLNTVRNVPPQGYHMFTCCDYVELGLTAPSEGWEQTMATSLIAASTKSLQPTPVELLASIKSRPDYLNVRPAVIQQILAELQCNSKEAEQSLSKATQAVVDKVRTESEPDLVRTLKDLHSQSQFLGRLARLSRGTDRVIELLRETQFWNMEPRFAALLCGAESFVPNQRYQLLPPYAHLCDLHLELSDDGWRGSLVVQPDESVDLDEYTMHTLRALHETKCLWYKEDIADLNHRVAAFLVGEGIGKRGTDGTLLPLTSMFDDPTMALLLERNLRIQKNAWNVYEKRLEEWKQDPVKYAQNHPLALELNSCIRNFFDHEVIAGGTSAEQLAQFGLKSIHVQKLVEIIADCMREFTHLEYQPGPKGFWTLTESRRTVNETIQEFENKRNYYWNKQRPPVAPTSGNRTPIL